MDTDQFWRWFSDNENTLNGFEDDVESVFDAITQELVKVDENVTFEISTPDASGKRQFVLTAGGLSSSFPAVEQLVDSAPQLERWTFIKYRQRADKLLNIEFGSLQINPDNVHYVVVKDQNPAKAGILLFFADYVEKQHDEFANVGYLILDQALGEYTVETRVGIIEMFDRSSKYFLSAKPVKELGVHFDAVVENLQFPNTTA